MDEQKCTLVNSFFVHCAEGAMVFLVLNVAGSVFNAASALLSVKLGV